MGSGLTMIDMLVSLEQRGVKGPINIVSRHGLIPEVHADFKPIELALGRYSPREWLKIFRNTKNSWRSVFQALRPHSQAIWRDFSPNQKKQFLRHLRPWWDSHRHRIAPQIHRFLSHALASNLSIYAGRLLKAQTSERDFVVNFQGSSTIFL